MTPHLKEVRLARRVSSAQLPGAYFGVSSRVRHVYIQKLKGGGILARTPREIKAWIEIKVERPVGEVKSFTRTGSRR